MRKKVYLILATLCICLLTGCGFQADISVNKDMTVDQTGGLLYTPKEMKRLGENTDELKKVKYDGKTYYADIETEKGSWKDWNEDGHHITNNTVALSIANTQDVLKLEFMDVTVHVPFKVEYTNGTVIDDNTVNFKDPDFTTLIVSGEKGVLKGKDIAFYDTVTEEVIKDGHIFSATELAHVSAKNGVGLDKIKVESFDSVIESATLIHGEDETEFCPYAGTNVIDVTPSMKVENKKVTITGGDGKYKIKAKAVSGAEETLTYYVDTKFPTITVKDGKLTFKDKSVNGFSSGIKSATVNGKKVKSGCKVKSGDKIVVTDKAGNKSKKTVK